MSRITNFYYSEVDSIEKYCIVYFDTSPPIPAEAAFMVNANNIFTPVFPNEINPGGYYQRVYGLVEGDNTVQMRIDYEGETYLSEVITVPVEKQVIEPEPPREVDPPKITVRDITIERRVPCKVEYSITSTFPVIQHLYSKDDGETWNQIEPMFIPETKRYTFTEYYKVAGEYKILLKAINNYWDESEETPLNITVNKGEMDEPGYHVEQSDDFTIIIDVPDPVAPPEGARIYWVVNCANYTDESLANNALKDLKEKGYDTAKIEKVEVN